MSIAVILRPFVRIAEDFISFCGLLELFFCGFIAGITVRVELHGYLAVGFFDLICRGPFRNAQHFVIISF